MLGVNRHLVPVSALAFALKAVRLCAIIILRHWHIFAILYGRMREI
jgi:hypothetical protein